MYDLGNNFPGGMYPSINILGYRLMYFGFILLLWLLVKVKKVLCIFFSIPMTGMTKMSFSPPVLTEEEDTLYGSKFLTDDLKCDGCLAISHQLHESFMKKYDNRPASLGLLSQSDVIELAGT